MLKILEAVHEVQAAIDHVPDDKKAELITQIIALSHKLLSSITEVGNIPGYYQEQLRPDMEAQLNAAEKRTEKAADTFLNIAEALTALSAKADPALRDALQSQVNAIFEASSFQDLVAQHLNEVKLRLKELNEHMEALQQVFSGAPDSAKGRKKPLLKPTGDPLLNGPSTDV